MPNSKTKTLYCNGVIVGDIEITGDDEVDTETAREFLKQKGLYQETTSLQSIYQQAVSFATTSAYLYEKDLLKAPRNKFSVIPFIVNSTFSIELYFKTLHIKYGTATTGHQLLKLYDSLPQEAINRVNLTIPNYANKYGFSKTIDFRACISDLNNAFVEWRYIHENNQKKKIEIQKIIFVMEVLHIACGRPDDIE